jgi:UDP-galactopyranose mutase
VFQYLSQFTQWRNYEHRVLAQVDGKMVPIPINLDTINKLYDLNLTEDQLEDFFAARAEKKEQIPDFRGCRRGACGRELYEKMFRGYTRKQWGLDPVRTGRVRNRAHSGTHES